MLTLEGAFMKLNDLEYVLGLIEAYDYFDMKFDSIRLYEVDREILIEMMIGDRCLTFSDMDDGGYTLHDNIDE